MGISLFNYVDLGMTWPPWLLINQRLLRRWSGLTVIERMSKSKSMYSFSKKTTNQNTASNNYFILNGHYWSPNTQHVLKCFMIVIPTYQLWKNMYMYNWQIWMLSDLIKRYTVTDVICWCHGKNAWTYHMFDVYLRSYCQCVYYNNHYYMTCKRWRHDQPHPIILCWILNIYLENKALVISYRRMYNFRV